MFHDWIKQLSETEFLTQNLTRCLTAFANFISRCKSVLVGLTLTIKIILRKHVAVKILAVSSLNFQEPNWGQFNGCWDASAYILDNILLKPVGY